MRLRQVGSLNLRRSSVRGELNISKGKPGKTLFFCYLVVRHGGAYSLRGLLRKLFMGRREYCSYNKAVSYR